jgi:hypothetical protein
VRRHALGRVQPVLREVQGNLLDASNLLNGNNYSDSIWGL